jgi:hypothetical protein
MATGTNVIEAASTYLNDFGLRTWTKERLFVHLIQAHKQLQVDLILHGIPVIKKTSSIIDVPASTTSLDGLQPSDLVEPISVWERAGGSSDNFVQMTEKGWEPETTQGTELRYWIWQGEFIKFLGATTARDVKIKYKAAITVPDQEGSTLGFLFAENYLSPKTAALAALSLGNLRAYGVLSGIADVNLERVIRLNIKGQQSLPARRRPYRRARRRFRVY